MYNLRFEDVHNILECSILVRGERDGHLLHRNECSLISCPTKALAIFDLLRPL